MTLGDKQRRFTLMVSELIRWAYDHGMELTFGDAYRSPEQAAWNAKNGAGITNSLHTIRLAVDLNLFKDGVYQKDTSAYQLLGEKWESMGGSWGGRFLRPDGNHFGLEHEGVR